MVTTALSIHPKLDWYSYLLLYFLLLLLLLVLGSWCEKIISTSAVAPLHIAYLFIFSSLKARREVSPSRLERIRREPKWCFQTTGVATPCKTKHIEFDWIGLALKSLNLNGTAYAVRNTERTQMLGFPDPNVFNTPFVGGKMTLFFDVCVFSLWIKRLIVEETYKIMTCVLDSFYLRCFCFFCKFPSFFTIVFFPFSLYKSIDFQIRILTSDWWKASASTAGVHLQSSSGSVTGRNSSFLKVDSEWLR